MEDTKPKPSPHYIPVTKASIEAAKAASQVERLRFFVETGVVVGDDGFLIKPQSNLVH